MKNQYPYRQENRFQTPSRSGQVVSPYDQDSALFQDLDQRATQVTYTQTINLSEAGSLLIPVSGYHFCCYGHDGQDNKTVDTTVLLNAYINQQSDAGGPNAAFPAKHGRGYSGPFAKIFFTWPAQENSGQPRYADIVIYKGANQPWIDGEAPT